MIENLEGESATTQRIVREAIQHLNSSFKQNPFRFFREAELHSHLLHLLIGDPMVACDSKWGSCPLVHQEYPTPFKCNMANGGFEMTGDDSRFRRGQYDLVVLNPWWIDNPWWTDKASPEALMGADFRVFCEEIRDKTHQNYPPFCLVGVEMHLVRSDPPRKRDYELIRQDYRKLLFSGALSNGWRFIDHRYMLVYSHYAPPEDAEWTRLQKDAARGATDLENAWIAWTSANGTRWSG